MITRDVDAFLAVARGCAPDFGPATARAAFLVVPDGFARAAESAGDNRYMAAAGFDGACALAEHRALQRAMSAELPTLAFPGDPRAPDGLFPNNVFATVPGRLVVGRMRYPVRRLEARREDVRRFFTDVMGYEVHDLSTQEHPCELTGVMVVDRARGLGFAGLSGRCDEEGAALVHRAFGLRATLVAGLAPGEYHANVVLAILAGRAALVCPDGFADPGPVLAALDALYGPHVVRLSAAERGAFAGNAISLGPDTVWMSAGAEAALSGSSRSGLAAAGFEVRAVPLEAIEAAGGSLRCCVAEIY